MGFRITEGVRWLYGPVGFPHYSGDLKDLVLSPHPQSEIERQFGIIAVITHYDSVGICARPTYTRQCRHALARTRSTPSDRHTPSDRQVPFARRGTSRLTRYTLSDRYFHGGCSGEAPGALAGWLLMVWGSWVVYYARSPDHQQPSHKCPRCFSTAASVKMTYVTGWTSSIGHVISRQTGCTSSSKRTSSIRGGMSIGRERPRPSQGMPALSCARWPYPNTRIVVESGDSNYSEPSCQYDLLTGGEGHWFEVAVTV